MYSIRLKYLPESGYSFRRKLQADLPLYTRKSAQALTLVRETATDIIMTYVVYAITLVHHMPTGHVVKLKDCYYMLSKGG
jgi:hypothetical protein